MFTSGSPTHKIKLIKSVQRATISMASRATTATATINSVDTSRSVVFYTHAKTSNASQATNTDAIQIDLTDATTITGTRDTGGSITLIAYVTVVEFDSAYVKSVQRGSISFNGSQTSNTATISSVSTSNAFVLFNGFTGANSAAYSYVHHAAVELTNATTVTAYKNTAANAGTAGFTVLEFVSGIVTVEKVAATFATNATAQTFALTGTYDLNRTMLVYNGLTSGSANVAVACGYGVLTAGNQITISRNSTTNTTRTYRYTVVQFAPGLIKSIQRGFIPVYAAARSNTATITGVDIDRSVLNFTGMQANSNTSTNRNLVTGQLTNSTTVQAEKTINSNSAYFGYEVVEFV